MRSVKKVEWFLRTAHSQIKKRSKGIQLNDSVEKWPIRTISKWFPFVSRADVNLNQIYLITKIRVFFCGLNYVSGYISVSSIRMLDFMRPSHTYIYVHGKDWLMCLCIWFIFCMNLKCSFCMKQRNKSQRINTQTMATV